jgi:hypothetical protein
VYISSAHRGVHSNLGVARGSCFLDRFFAFSCESASLSSHARPPEIRDRRCTPIFSSLSIALTTSAPAACSRSQTSPLPYLACSSFFLSCLMCVPSPLMSSPLLLMHSSSPPLPDPLAFFLPVFWSSCNLDAVTRHFRRCGNDLSSPIFSYQPSSFSPRLFFACLLFSFSSLLFSTLPIPSAVVSFLSLFKLLFSYLCFSTFFLASFRSSLCSPPAPRLYSLSFCARLN